MDPLDSVDAGYLRSLDVESRRVIELEQARYEQQQANDEAGGSKELKRKVRDETGTPMTQRKKVCEPEASKTQRRGKGDEASASKTERRKKSEAEASKKPKKVFEISDEDEDDDDEEDDYGDNGADDVDDDEDNGKSSKPNKRRQYSKVWNGLSINMQSQLVKRRVALIVVSIVMLVVTFLGLVSSICTADTCVAMSEWVERPSSNTALDEILPCTDNATAQESLMRSREMPAGRPIKTFRFIDSVRSAPYKEPKCLTKIMLFFTRDMEQEIQSYVECLMDTAKMGTCDCSFSGSTGVVAITQGDDLVIANLGDSRAVLGTMTEDGEIKAVQLTSDLTPDVPSEAERIRMCKGRVFAMKTEPSSQRVWLPNQNIPGLAMSRAFGDFRLKDHGVIAVPEISQHRITSKDQFLVLATDGVWDMLSNDEVVSLIWSSGKKQASAAKMVAEAAEAAWKKRLKYTKVDDITVICLFLQNKEQPS
ncbi:PPM-type phosphatase domain [Arabidopsis suecica]|uniref:PPM-type phosphatase domain n=1 Tax=Arabidopsis suecica TaxID=45249 RepID=A0A8T2DG91_ARASU|nr:PPM-type phosphatase domain [Arabidopsis suecica]